MDGSNSGTGSQHAISPRHQSEHSNNFQMNSQHAGPAILVGPDDDPKTQPYVADEVRAKIPPAALRSKQYWLTINRELARLGLSFLKVQNTMNVYESIQEQSLNVGE